ncbi:Ubiquitin carboxyl-terminal hydrolase 5 [Lamellibrachia satsuma]|nr:Ubiquitin carboxyl-terminal hydrolase 5 [Lamellibrachia satsuma]
MLTRVTLRPVAGDVAAPPSGPHLAADLFLRASAHFGVLQEFFISRMHLGHKGLAAFCTISLSVRGPQVADPCSMLIFSGGTKVRVDDRLVQQLVEMGFPLEGCRKGVYHTGNSNIEAAMNWVMEHMNDQDFEVPLEVLQTDLATEANFTINEDAVAMLSSMGFTRDQAIKALKSTDNNLERAADWIFSHASELEVSMETDQSSGQTVASSTCRDGGGRYQLVAFISHMGTSTMVGHYVCHVLKDGRWVIFNDEKVALSEHPPKELAYLYLYKRV